MDSKSEQPPQNPEQEPKGVSIPKVIQELSESARLLADPRLLNPKANPEDGYNHIRYLSADDSIYVDLWKADIINSSVAHLPKDIEHNEKIIPLTCGTWKIPPYSEGGLYEKSMVKLEFR
jgi:hypothetical protein